MVLDVGSPPVVDPNSLFVQIKGIQLLPASTVPEAARVSPSLGAQQGRF